MLLIFSFKEKLSGTDILYLTNILFIYILIKSSSFGLKMKLIQFHSFSLNIGDMSDSFKSKLFNLIFKNLFSFNSIVIIFVPILITIRFIFIFG